MDLFERLVALCNGKLPEKGLIIFHLTRVFFSRARSIVLPVTGFGTREETRICICMRMYMHVKCSHAHPRRDRSWEKVRQSEANLVIGIRSTPDGDHSPLSRHVEESTLSLIQVRLQSFRLDVIRSEESNRSKVITVIIGARGCLGSISRDCGIGINTMIFFS